MYRISNFILVSLDWTSMRAFKRRDWDMNFRSRSTLLQKKIFIWIFYLGEKRHKKLQTSFRFILIFFYNSDDRFNKISLSTKCGSFLIFFHHRRCAGRPSSDRLFSDCTLIHGMSVELDCCRNYCVAFSTRWRWWSWQTLITVKPSSSQCVARNSHTKSASFKVSFQKGISH